MDRRPPTPLLDWAPPSRAVLLAPLPLSLPDLELADPRDEACLLDLEDQLLVSEDHHPPVDLEDSLEVVSPEHHQVSLAAEEPLEDHVRFFKILNSDLRGYLLTRV
jgi:hypothetical protein